MGFQEILQEHDRRQARRFPKAPLPEGVDEGDIEDFTALETWQAGGKARRTGRMTILHEDFQDG